MSGILAAMVAMGGQQRITVTGATVDDASGNIAGVRFNSDGTVDKRENSTYTQINASTDWIVPNAPTLAVEIRCDVNSGTVEGDSTGAWLSLSASQSREWRTPGPAGAASVDISIRNLAGTLLSSAAYTFTAVAP